MKTKNTLAAMIIAIVAFTTFSAFAQEEPAIRIYPTGQNLKVVFGYDSTVPVTIDFIDNQGTFSSDQISQNKFKHGFIKTYSVKRDKQDTFWMEVKNNTVNARYKIKSTPKGQWVSTLETVTYNNPVAVR